MLRDTELVKRINNAATEQPLWSSALGLYGVADAVVEDAVTGKTPLELKTLNCSNAGIASLGGLGQFAGLTQLKFSDNRIRNLVELGQLSNIESLWLDNNDVVDPVPLAQLRKLYQLDLTNNPKLQCPKSGVLDHVATLTVPEHCQTAAETSND